MSEKFCGKCEDTIADKGCLQCGFCGYYFHKRCSRLDTNSVKLVESNNAICWKCSSCSAFSFPDLLIKIGNLAEEISTMRNDLHNEISNLKTLISYRSSGSNLGSGNSVPTNSLGHRYHQAASLSPPSSSAAAAHVNILSTSSAKSSRVTLSARNSDLGSSLNGLESSSQTGAHAAIMPSLAMDNAAAISCEPSPTRVGMTARTQGEEVVINTNVANNNNNLELPSNRKQRNSKLVFGTDLSANGLSVINRLSCLHISRFHSSMNSDKLKKIYEKYTSSPPLTPSLYSGSS